MLVVFNNFLLIDATDRSKISGDQKRFFIALRLYPLSFFANTPFNVTVVFGVLVLNTEDFIMSNISKIDGIYFLTMSRFEI